MEQVEVKCPVTGETKVEKVYPEALLHYLYSSNSISAKVLRFAVGRSPLCSALIGYYQKFPWTRRKIDAFIRDFEIDASEFEKISFASFNDFFTRKLKKEARPISDALLIAPADGRYRAYEKASLVPPLSIKGTPFSLFDFLGKDRVLYEKYKEGPMILIRLAPTDYHRFHFPVDCIPSAPKKIGFSLYSVHPIALKQNFNYLSQNKRALIELSSPTFGSIAYLPIGATGVGSLRFTYKTGVPYRRGDEMGFFSFGGSSIVLLFEKSLPLSETLLANTLAGYETLCQMGAKIGDQV